MINFLTRRFQQRPLVTLACLIGSSLSLIACTPRQNNTADELPADCAELAQNYETANDARFMVTGADEGLQRSMVEAIETAGYNLTEFRDGMKLITLPRPVMMQGQLAGHDQQPVSMGIAREQGINYPLYLALVPTDIATGTRADGEPSYGLYAVSDMGTVIGPNAEGEIVRFLPQNRQLTELQMQRMPEALRRFDTVPLADGRTLEETYARLTAAINSQGRNVARAEGAIEAARRADPAHAHMCEDFILGGN